MKVPKHIIRVADRIIAKSIEEGNNSKILRSKNLLVKIFTLRYNGNNSENNIAHAVGIDRINLNRIVKRGIERPKSAYGIFTKYWYKFYEELEGIILNDLAERAKNPETPTAEKIKILQLLRPDKYRYDPTGGNRPGNQTLQITNNYFSPDILDAAKMIVDLPKEQRQIALKQLDEIVVEPDNANA